MTREPMPLSVVIPHFNRRDTLPAVLESLANQSVSSEAYEVLIVDDGSAFDVSTMLAALDLPGSFKLIKRSKLGAAAARNYGARIAKGEVLVFLDSDVIGERQLLEEHLRIHVRQGHRIVAGRSYAAVPEESDLFCRVMGDELYANDLGEKEVEASYLNVTSRNMSLKKATFDVLGGFDEAFPHGFEDVELAYRARQKGMEIIYSPLAVGEHRHYESLEEMGQHMYTYQISAAQLMQKHPAIRGEIPHLVDKESIDLRRDSRQLIARKSARSLLALRPVRWAVKEATVVLGRANVSPKVLRLLYWQVLGTQLFLGYREGLRRYPNAEETGI